MVITCREGLFGNFFPKTPMRRCLLGIRVQNTLFKPNSSFQAKQDRPQRVYPLMRKWRKSPFQQLLSFPINFLVCRGTRKKRQVCFLRVDRLPLHHPLLWSTNLPIPLVEFANSIQHCGIILDVMKHLTNYHEMMVGWIIHRMYIVWTDFLVWPVRQGTVDVTLVSTGR